MDQLALNDVLFEKRGRLGVITLNRPGVINAVNQAMVSAIHRTLADWAVDDAVRAVLLTGNGDRGLCVGGDIAAIFRDATGGSDGSLTFWRDEYLLDAAIARYPKPVVTLMDGIVLGGGIGLAAHASHRVVTERSSLGMPEVTIGFVPDVGGTWLLSRAPGELGTHLALTAGTVNGADAIALGFADQFVPSARLPELVSALETTEPDEAIAGVAQAPQESALLSERGWIDEAYSGNSVGDILLRLGESRPDVAATISRKSPTALAVTLASLRRASNLPDLETVLEQEFRVSTRLLRTPDLAEGIRAQVIDKDRNPRWDPADIAAVTPEMVNRFFEPLPGVELELSRGMA